jgi:hypothetical protein
MLEDNAGSKHFENGADRNQPTRRWHCPKDRVIAGYVDGTLAQARRSGVERHLADCGYCRALVADIVKVSREAEIPAVPTLLVAKALAILPPQPKPWRRIWAPATVFGAAVVCALIAATVLVRQPERLILPSWSAPTPPIVLEDGTQPSAGAPTREIVRTQAPPQLSPSIISPKADSAVTRKSLGFYWTAVPHTAYYQVRIVTAEGELVWEGQSNGTRLELPSDTALHNGKYFVLVSAVLENGHVMKSDPVRFQMAGSR